MAKIVEYINPITGAPEQVDQLDHTAQQIDDGIDRAFLVPGQNLLDNSVFLPGYLVDQRQGYVVPPGTAYYSDTVPGSSPAGTTTAYYTATVLNIYWVTITISGVTYYVAMTDAVRGYTGDGYGPDMWYNIGNIVLIEEGGLRLINNAQYASAFRQMLPLGPYKGKQIVVSMRTDSADAILMVYVGTGVNSGLVAFGSKKIDDGLACVYGTVPDNTNATYLVIGISAPVGTEIFVKAAALNPGDHQTAFHQDANGNWQLNELPNYADTLARCQISRLKLDGLARYRAITITADTIDFFIPTPSTMRATPSIAFEGTPTPSPTVYDWSTGANHYGFVWSVIAKSSNGVYVRGTKTAHGLSDACVNFPSNSYLIAEL